MEAVLTTENPTRVWDWDQWDVVEEVLRMDGLEIPRQVPLLDSHNRNSIDDQLGSTVNIRKEDGKLIGTRRFAKGNKKAERAAKLVEQGHLTDGSIGYQVRESTWVEKDDIAIISGREYEGPVKVATRWVLLEDSVTPIGADSGAKVRNLETVSQVTEKEQPMEDVKVDTPAAPPVDVEAAEARGRESERKRILAIRQLAKLAGLPELSDELIESGKTEEEARELLYAKAEEAGAFGGRSKQAPPVEGKPEARKLDAIKDDELARALNSPALFID